MVNEKIALIMDIFRDLRDFFGIFEQHQKRITELNPDEYLCPEEPDKSLFYLAFCLRDALIAISRLCDPEKQNIGIVLRTNEYWERIQTLFPKMYSKYSK